MTGPSTDDDVERVYRYLVEHITAKRYPPLRNEIARAMGWDKMTWGACDRRLKAAIEALRQAGKIRLGRPTTGARLDIKLGTLPTQDHHEAAAVHLAAAARPAALTVDGAIDWRRMLKEFRGVVVSKLTATQIARYYRKRCVETNVEQAEREANMLLGFRFPEMFLERRQILVPLDDFIDRQRSKRGCQSCGTKFAKIRPNQRYCSARCRRREKAHRREATSHGKLVKSRQNKRYRQKYSERERDRRRQWRESHPEQYRAQRSREGSRRRMDSKWNRRKYQGSPLALAGIFMNAVQLPSFGFGGTRRTNVDGR